MLASLGNTDTLTCPHCGVLISLPDKIFLPYNFPLNRKEGDDGATIKGGHCLSCGGVVIVLIKGKLDNSFGLLEPVLTAEETIMLYPSRIRTAALSPHVPSDVAKLYSEAYEVLTISPIASAALSRRLLQHIFHESLGIKARDLNAEVDLFIARKDVPKSLADNVDHIRTLGNFASHPIQNIHTSEVVDVEQGEAEESLYTLEQMIEFSYVLPVTEAERRSRFNDKLRDSNKPELKKRKE